MPDIDWAAPWEDHRESKRQPRDKPAGILSTLSATVSTKDQPALTLEDLERAFQAVIDQPYPEPHRHMLTVRGKNEVLSGGQARCVECGGVIEIRDGVVVVVGF